MIDFVIINGDYDKKGLTELKGISIEGIIGDNSSSPPANAKREQRRVMDDVRRRNLECSNPNCPCRKNNGE